MKRMQWAALIWFASPNGAVSWSSDIWHDIGEKVYSVSFAAWFDLLTAASVPKSASVCLTFYGFRFAKGVVL